MDKEQARERILSLVAKFESNYESYKQTEYNETQTRREFIDPFFKALGWDIDNEQGIAEAYKEVIHEDRVKVGGDTKAPDYCFTVYGQKKFFVEAKKPSVKIKDEIPPAYQVRRYGWSAKLAVSLITDFEEFSVYDCTKKPSPTDKASVSRIEYFTFRDYAEKFDFLWNTFSKEGVLKGNLDRYLSAENTKKGTAAVDREFLKSMDEWRKNLATNIALRNASLSEADINRAVQLIIDRLIFLRICEDRMIEPYGAIRNAAGKDSCYSKLSTVFIAADQKYNSGLFDFNKDKLTPSLGIDDKVMKAMIAEMYYPECPYQFDAMPVEILGNTYEQFLGKVIRLTDGHRAKIEEKPEVRKAGGVYYTPQYIVDYIVKHTVGELLSKDGMTPDDAARIKVLDPACGSGSFLLGAYQHLLDWHLDWYKSHNVTKKGKLAVITPDGRLSTSEKKRILLNNIHGVDIDAQAVEVTKLSLLLKCLEGETDASIKSEMSLFHERVLPTLDDNIKCGNSLIGPDYFAGKLLPDGEELARVNPFDWEREFPEVFGRAEKDGGKGFDCVIGNPPWGALFSNEEKEHLRNTYEIFHIRTPESYNYFIGRMATLTKGMIGVIIPSSFLNQHEFVKTRKYLVVHTKILRICNLGDGVFENVTAPSCILISNTNTTDSFISSIVPLYLDYRNQNTDILPTLLSNETNGQKATMIGKDSNDYILQLRDGVKIVQKCYKWNTLKTLAEDVATGISSGLDKAYVYTEKECIENKFEKTLLRKLIIGGEIGRYWCHPVSTKKIIYITDDVDIRDYPNIQAILLPHKDKLKKRREAANGKIPWFALNWPRRIKLFEKNKILIRQTADHIMACADYDGWYCLKSGIIVQLPDDSIMCYSYVLGLLNSRLINYLYYDLVGEQSRVFPEVKPIQLFKLPIRTIDFSNPDDKKKHDLMVTLVDRMLDLHKKKAAAKDSAEGERIDRLIDATDREIDQLVYGLYGLTEEEIRIVEGK